MKLFKQIIDMIKMYKKQMDAERKVMTALKNARPMCRCKNRPTIEEWNNSYSEVKKIMEESGIRYFYK